VGLLVRLMPMDAIRTAAWVLLMAQAPGQPIRPAGILLLDPLTDKLHTALDDFVSADDDIREVWESLKEELADKASEMGGARCWTGSKRIYRCSCNFSGVSTLSRRIQSRRLKAYSKSTS
jgi:hypothetical protein